MSLESTQSVYLDGSRVKTCSMEIEKMIDDEIRQILTDCQNKATELLSHNCESLDKIAKHLLEKENITGYEFMKLLEA